MTQGHSHLIMFIENYAIKLLSFNFQCIKKLFFIVIQQEELPNQSIIDSCQLGSVKLDSIFIKIKYEYWKKILYENKPRIRNLDLQIRKQGEFLTEQSINYGISSLFGAISNDGEYSITWDTKLKQIGDIKNNENISLYPYIIYEQSIYIQM
ncbi:unnamed protein product [Paramecium pentaurelia]|uniref:Uncharacterized protein n=1 Tax=Paramecium pentaurelia TaxID=43138 RepID=A0A8S1YG11_9CILI|nr:unnamed protein product [Paramecium pentaurelia]